MEYIYKRYYSFLCLYASYKLNNPKTIALAPIKKYPVFLLTVNNIDKFLNYLILHPQVLR